VSRLVLVGATISSNHRLGGVAWHFLSWALGLRRLGFDVVLVDQLDRVRCVNPAGTPAGYEGCLNLGWCHSVTEQFSLSNHVAVLGAGGESLLGLSYEEVLELAGQAEMLVNIAGSVRLPALKQRVARRVMVDLDPGITQLWLAAGRAAPRIEGHDVFFTLGQNVGKPACTLPTGGVRWIPTWPPVLLDEWPVVDGGDRDLLTTVTSWRPRGPHGTVEELGFAFPHKADELLELADLPQQIPQAIEMVVRPVVGEAEIMSLARRGWIISNPEVVATPDAYRSFIQRSGGELSPARGMYTATQSGWWSERTGNYLASGRPAIVQDTGLGGHLPLGTGLLTFSTRDEAVQAARRISEDYEQHSRAARAIAEEYLDSDRVLSRFVEQALQ